MSDDENDKEDKNKTPAQDDNVVRIPTLAERDRLRKNRNNGSGLNGENDSQTGGFNIKLSGRDFFGGDGPASNGAGEPLLNIPPMTKFLAGSILGVYALIAFFNTLVAPGIGPWLVAQFSFIPGRFTGELPFSLVTMITPVTYMWLHGGVFHVLLNCFMLVAFGAGVERWLGSFRLLQIFILCGLAGLLIHFIFFWGDTIPVVGASGGISGLFAVVLVMINKGRWRGGPGFAGGGILPFAILWIVISLLSGVFSGFGHAAVAWAVHLGGFLGGFILMWPYYQRNR